MTLGGLVIASLPGLLVYADMTNLPAGVQAPLYALIAANGLAVALGARADQTRGRFNWIVGVAAIGAAALSAYQWLVNENAGTAIELVGVAGAALALLALLVNAYDVEAEKRG